MNEISRAKASDYEEISAKASDYEENFDEENENLFIFTLLRYALSKLVVYGLPVSCLCQTGLGTMVVIHNNVILFAWGLLQLFLSLLFVHKLGTFSTRSYAALY